MFGKHHDIDNSFSSENETNTRDVGSLQIEIENLKEENQALQQLSLRPLVLKYELELKELKMKMTLASGVAGQLCLKNVVLWDDEIQTLTTFIAELIKGAHEHL